MCPKRVLGMLALLALVTGGVFAVDRWNKDAKVRQTITPLQVAANEPKPAAPQGQTTVHFQVDPSVPPLPPVKISETPPPAVAPMPEESKQPPLISTGELEKQLKQSLENLQKVLPSAATSGDAAFPPEPVKAPPSKTDSVSAEPKGTLPLPPPPVTTESIRPKLDEPKGAAVSPLPATPVVTDGVVQIQNKEAVNAAPKTSNDSAPLPLPAPPRELKVESTLPVQGTSVPVAPTPITPPEVKPGVEVRTPANPSSHPADVKAVVATVASQDDFQRRLTELEIKYLKDTVAELDRRIEQMPAGDGDRKKLELNQQQVSERLARLMKVAEWNINRRIDDALGKTAFGESPWIMNLETVNGKTVLQAIVHHKARFKVVCDRLDLQTPHGTLLAVGNVQLSGEGFQGACDRLSIPLHDDRLILEGSAEVGIRTQAATLIEERKDKMPPVIESRGSTEDATSSSNVPVLHLKGEHLDLRWRDLQPTTAESTRADEPLTQTPTIRGSAGPMVKVAYTSPSSEQWSAWGILRRSSLSKEGRPAYVIEDRDGNPLALIQTPPGMSLQEYLGKRVSVFGRASRGENGAALSFLASHIAWE